MCAYLLFVFLWLSLSVLIVFHLSIAIQSLENYITMEVLNIGMRRKVQHIKIEKKNTEYLARSEKAKYILTHFMGIDFYSHRQTKLSITKKTSSCRKMELIGVR